MGIKRKQHAQGPPDLSELRAKRNALNQQITALTSKAESTAQAINEFKTATKMAGIMNKRVEKASYMTDIAKGSLQMAVNERDMAKVEGANAVQAEASAKVRKYEERIEMSKLTEKQDEELLGLAKERVASAKATAEKVRLAEQKEQKEKHDAYIASLEKDAAYTKSEKKLKLTGKEQAEKKAIKDAHDLKVEKETGAKAAAKAEEDASIEANQKIVKAKEANSKTIERHKKQQETEETHSKKENKSKATENGLKMKEGSEKAYSKAKEQNAKIEKEKGVKRESAMKEEKALKLK